MAGAGPTNEPGAWLGSYKAVKKGGAEFTLDGGPGPSKGWIVIKNSEAKAIEFRSDGHIFEMHDGFGGVRRLKHMYVVDKEEYGPDLTKCIIADSRLFWKNQYVTKHYNVTYDDGKTFNPKTTKDGLSTAGWTFKEIVEDLLDILKGATWGFAKINTKILDAIDTAANPLIKNLICEAVPASEVLAYVLSRAGGTLSADVNGKVVVTMPKEDYFSSAKSEVEKWIKAKTEPRGKSLAIQKPKTLKIHYRILREKLFKNRYWKPVMRHDGLNGNGGEISDKTPGAWYEVSEVLEDWGFTEGEIRKKYFFLAEQLNQEKDPTKAKHIQAILDEFYKCFRYQPTSASTDARSAVLPFHDEMGATATALTGEAFNVTPRPGKNCEMMWPCKMFANECLIKGRPTPDELTIEDEDQGIIRFTTRVPVTNANPTGAYAHVMEAYELEKPSQVEVIIPYLKKYVDADDLADDFHTHTYIDTWTSLSDNGHIEEKIDTSVYYIEQDLGGTGSFTALNATDISSRAEMYAEDFFRSFESGDAQDMVSKHYIPKIERLCGKLKSVQFAANTDGYTETYRLFSGKSLNPYRLNYLERRPQRLVGDTIDTSSPNPYVEKSVLPMSAMDLHAIHPAKMGNVGLRVKGATPDHRPSGVSYERFPRFVNTTHDGVMVGMDLGFTEGQRRQNRTQNPTNQPNPGPTSGGTGGIGPQAGAGRSDQPANASQGSGAGQRRNSTGYGVPRNKALDHRTKFCRIQEFGTKLRFDRVRKFNMCTNFGDMNWEATIVTPEMKRDAPRPSQVTPQPSGGLTGIDPNPLPRSGGSGSTGGGSYRAVTSSTPRPSGTGQQGPAQADSTHIWVDEPEGKGGTAKGPLRDVLMVGIHRKKGVDPDGNPIHQAEVDKVIRKVHKNNVECGPTIDEGQRIQPPPVGFRVHAAQIFDPTQKGWVHDAWVPTDLLPVPEPGTPNPPGPGQPPGPGNPGPISTPTPEQPPIGMPAPPAPGDPGWSPPPDMPPPGDVNEVAYMINPTSDGHSSSFPGEISAGFPPRGGQPESYFAWGRKIRNRLRPGGLRTFASRLDPRYNSLPHHTPKTWENHIYTPGGSTVGSPYFPGTHLNPNRRYPAMRRSPYFPGTAPISKADRERYDIDTPPTSHAWDDTTVAAERETNTEWKNKTQGEALVDLRNDLNTAHSRVETLDSARRAFHTINDTVAMPTNKTTVDYSPATVFSAAPTAVVSQACSIAVHNFNHLACAVVADGDGTYTFTITAETADPAGPHDISIAITGPVADTEDIDP